MSIITQTHRIIIREFLFDELETYLNHFTDERVILHLPKRSTQERTTIFKNALSQYLVSRSTGIWGMFDKSNHEFMGSCLLRSFDEEPGAIELGYSMEYKYWGQGMGTEMAKAMVEHGFEGTSVPSIVGITTMNNIASQKVLEKAGFMRDGNMVRADEQLALFRIYR
ncbi:MAG: GNAT family N-acetyltransferase [Bacteroidota bacterium]